MINQRVINLSSVFLFLFVYILLFYPAFLNGSLNHPLFFCLLFCLVILYLIFDFWGNISGKDKTIIKLVLLLFIIIFISATSILAGINFRQSGQGFISIHDGALQTEVATSMLLAGRNFYQQDFKGTIVEQLNHGQIPAPEGMIANPAIDHYVYLPFYVILTAPFYLLSHLFFNMYDQRMLVYVFYLLSLFFLYRLVPGQEKKLSAVVLLGLNPWFLAFVVSGRNDVVIIFFLLLVIWLLRKNRYLTASIFLALTILIKHTAILLAPFYLFYLLYQKKSFRDGLIFLWQKIWPALILIVAVLLPFLCWDFRSFWQDVYQYPAGSLPTSYPITGYGFGLFLYIFGFIKSSRDYYPFIIWQAVICWPVLLLLLKLQKQHNSVNYMFLAYTIFLALFWFFSRFFNDNYIVFLGQLLLIVYFINTPVEEGQSSLLKLGDKKEI